MKSIFALSSMLLLGSGPTQDPFFNAQWGLHNNGSSSVAIEINDQRTIKQPGKAGVDIGWSEAQLEIQNKKQSPIIVAVIDSGIDETHPDLQGRVLTDGKNFLDESQPPNDDIGHGTHVAGIIAANSQNGIGISGVTSPAVKILPLKVLGDGFIYTYPARTVSTFTAKAIDYAVAHHASVINMSLAWPSYSDSQEARASIYKAVQAGVMIIASAGNDRKNQPTFPCSYEGVICVGAITNNGNLTQYSDFGGRVDILAPGDDIVSLFPKKLDPDNLRIQGYDQLSGTSQAAPHVAGIAAMMKSLNPTLSLNEWKARLLAATSTPPQAGAALYGLVNYKRALSPTQQSIWIPQFKILDSVPINEKNLEIQGSLSVQNLFKDAQNAVIEVRIKNQLVGSLHQASVKSGDFVFIPWSYRFQSMDESADLQMLVSISDASGFKRDFYNDFSVVREVEWIQNQQHAPISSAQTGVPTDWFGMKNGRNIFKLKDYRVLVYGSPENEAPYYYQQITSPKGVKESTLVLIDSSKKNGARRVLVPNINAGVAQVLHMDVNQDGVMDWVVLGLANEGSGESATEFLQFYFLDSNLNPLFGNQSAWKIKVDPRYRNAVMHSYAVPGSWILHEGHLVPAGIAESLLLPEEKFKGIVMKNYQFKRHLFFLKPNFTDKTANNTVPLTLKMLDGLDFQKANPELVIQGFGPMNMDELRAGHIRVLTNTSIDFDSSVKFLEFTDTTHSTFKDASSWNLLSFSGKIMNTIPTNTTTYALFTDNTRGSINWINSQSQISESTHFNYTDILNPIMDVAGVFELPQYGRSWFVLSRFQLVAFHGQKQIPLQIEREQSFSFSEIKDMYSPVLAGTDQNPLPGIYIDSTSVRGNQVSIAVLDPQTDLFQRSIRYSLEIPPTCIPLRPTPLNSHVESLSFHLVCKTNGLVEFRLVNPQ